MTSQTPVQPLHVDLSAEWPLVERIASERHLQKRDYQSHRRLTDNPDLVGIAGEIAYGKYRGVSPDLSLKPEGDARPDFGRTEVKSTRYATGRLVMFPDEELVADYYVLVIVDVPRRTARMAGWAARAEVDAASLCDLGWGERRVITQTQLRSMDELS